MQKAYNIWGLQRHAEEKLKPGRERWGEADSKQVPEVDVFVPLLSV